VARRRPWTAALALVFGARFLLALMRVPVLVPRFGKRVAELIEIPVMLVVIVAVARGLVRRRAEAPTPADGRRWAGSRSRCSRARSCSWLLARRR
jgi:hypothetical protein